MENVMSVTKIRNRIYWFHLHGAESSPPQKTMLSGKDSAEAATDPLPGLSPLPLRLLRPPIDVSKLDCAPVESGCHNGRVSVDAENAGDGEFDG